MTGITVFIILGAIASLAILVAGGISMAKGGKYDEAHSIPLMEAEVIVQALIIGMLLIAAFFWL
ncbi:hypothetical protein BOV90_08640 [Solemya velum gill symbiont]|uniref:HIG1 domain-containing protein n=1 Tax=Solemya velum gill symbiont TaxID=2340 RepID=A0A0B0HGC1_SOVGS|nr:HIG1 domain-containing protein [Solemya velum gill symbiont]KHF26516.1 hypothetical protein JV46_17340 [Solemya velum gill symbiont]OOY35426.1 hypothetical protein BOV88_04025 [Solemya velum gill symbiont]OOY38621.1 hypothetical protein BOV89_02150 [Solemya velum gill symbiont]OOY39579.1 hypothetical protein BOV90_08640 [Solemya velum gill symbiont]OOY42336.1 hypothetical protein BOV91_07325 [Solemya velum gill symbiont]